MNQLDKDTLKALGLVTERRPQVKLDLSALLKDRYHHKLSFQAIADKYGTSKQAVQDRLARFTEQLGHPDELRGFQEVEQDIQQAIKRRYSSHLLDADLSKLGAKDAAMVYGIVFDKNRLQTGQSTSHTSVFFHVVSESDTLKTITVDNTDT